MNIDKVNLSKAYKVIPYKDFKKSMQNIGFDDGDYDAAYESIGGILPKKKKQKEEGEK